MKMGMILFGTTKKENMTLAVIQSVTPKCWRQRNV